MIQTGVNVNQALRMGSKWGPQGAQNGGLGALPGAHIWGIYPCLARDLPKMGSPRVGPGTPKMGSKMGSILRGQITLTPV